MDEEFVHVSIYSEVHLAINFVTSFLNKMLPQGRIKLFGDALARALMNKYEGHWFPECPLKGSAFRCFEFGQYIEPEIKHAVRQAGLRCRDILVCVPPELSIWVDPGTVSYRIGIEGQVKPVLSESGCVTCFYDPDFHDEDPDPPGIARNGKYYDELDVLDLPIIQTLKEKHGKMKHEDIMFLTENGTEDYGPNTEGVRMMQSTTTHPQENLKIKLLMVMEAEGEPVTKGDRVMTEITIAKSAITVTKTEMETEVEVLPQAADVAAAATIMVATADKALVAAVMMMVLAAAVEAVSVSMSVMELVAAEMAAVAEMVAMAKMVAMIEMATEEMVVVEEMAVAMLVAAVLGAAMAMLGVAVLVAAVLVVVSAALVIGVVVVLVAAIAAAIVAMAPPPPPTTTAAPPTVVPVKRM